MTCSFSRLHGTKLFTFYSVDLKIKRDAIIEMLMC